MAMVERPESGATSRAGRRGRTRVVRLAKPALTLAIGGGLVWLLGARLGHLDPVAIRDAVYSVAPLQWALALSAVVVSFLAVGLQERVLHRHAGTGIAGAQAFRAGICAGAVSQTAGFGPVTGTLIRWRMMPDLTLWQATRLSAALTVAFLSSLAVLASVVLVTLHATRYETLGWLVLATAATVFALGTLRPLWLPRRDHWPNAVTMLAFLLWAALDLAALTFALWALFPAPHAPAFATLLPVALLALGAGLASGAPAGVGAFEMVLILFLPQVDEAALMAAVVAWRAVFYALPALAGMAWAAGSQRPALATVATAVAHPPGLSPRAEAGLIYQNDLAPLRLAAQTCLTGRTPHVLATLFEPFPHRPESATLAALQRQARAENRIAALYKCDARLAALARSAGLRPLRIALEAVVSPVTFTLDGPARATLRRKLRRAEAAGVTTTHGHDPHCPQLAAINTDWSMAHKGERGFSMGRFCPAYLSRQRIYVAWQQGRPVAFASFHTNASEWTLDLMRHGATLPDGTMHTLVAAALRDAAALGVGRLSLAAVPDLPPTFARLFPAPCGLHRFKQTFTPRWEPRYLCAPGLTGLALAALELGRAIRHPRPLPPISAQRTAFPDADTEYEFATVPASWHRKA